MRRKIPLLAAAAALAAASWAVLPAADQPPKDEIVPHGQDQMPGPPLSPAEAIKKMTVPDGFTVELVAAEPDIVNPVAMTFDERGRIWITESLEYPRAAAGPGRDRVKVLEDTDGDGKADKFTVFADGLNIPSGIAVGHGGVWVANSPDILFLQDTDGDGKADKQRGRRHRLRPLRHPRAAQLADLGPGRLALRLERRVQPQPGRRRTARRIDFTCAIFRIHPKTREFRGLVRGDEQPLGHRLDPEGSVFASACVIDHLWHLVETGYYIRQGGPYPPFTWPIESIVDHAAPEGGLLRHPLLRQRRLSRRVSRPALHGQHPRQLHQRRRARARTARPTPARPAPDFLTANDAWFMPVVAEDRARRLPVYPRLVRPLSLLPGRQPRPRRHRPAQGPALPRPLQGHAARAGFDLGKESDDELIERLRSPNVYDRDIAQRLLTERASPDDPGRSSRRWCSTRQVAAQGPDARPCGR